jgi:ankyrin repeat protein
MGNAAANSIWEAGSGAQKGWEKPKNDAGRKAKEEWIKSKYLWRGFLLFSDDDGKTHTEREDKFSKDLFNAAKECHLAGIASALAHGASVTWKNPDEEGRTALHACSLKRKDDDNKKWDAIESAELLIQNGAKVDTLDNADHGVLDCAVIGGAEREMIEYLTIKIG